MVSTLSRSNQTPDAPSVCGDCPFFLEGEDPKFGNCQHFNCETRCSDPSSFDCRVAYWDLANNDRPARDAIACQPTMIDRTLPRNLRGGDLLEWHEGRLFGFVRSDRSVFDVCSHYPTRKLIGRIELTDAGWKVINVDRELCFDSETCSSYMEAARRALHLSRNPVDRAGSRIGQFLVVFGLATLTIATLSQAAIAHRASGRDLPPPPPQPQQSQPYEPPDRGAPDDTVGSGTR